jgi:hypothetical protein
MNERIRELALQAISDVDYIRDDEFTNMELQKMYIPDCFSEKFAELIVKECIDYCGENLSKTVGGALKIHFGVEE